MGLNSTAHSGRSVEREIRIPKGRSAPSDNRQNAGDRSRVFSRGRRQNTACLSQSLEAEMSRVPVRLLFAIAVSLMACEADACPSGCLSYGYCPTTSAAPREACLLWVAHPMATCLMGTIPIGLLIRSRSFSIGRRTAFAGKGYTPGIP